MVFLGTFVVPSRTRVVDGRLVVEDGVFSAKFLADVEQCTFSGRHAAAAGRSVLYVTERCGLPAHQRRIAADRDRPRVDLERDIIAQMGFEPNITGELPLMDARIFSGQPMGLKSGLLSMPMDARFAYDDVRNFFFLTLRGLSLHTPEDVEWISSHVELRLAAVGRRVNLVLSDDTLHVAADLTGAYLGAIRRLADRYCQTQTRYPTRAFLRLKGASRPMARSRSL